ncbi:MAG TPA: hypothetical protein VFG30_42890 [Polyangiales bacterium]|nr:hypothetical protein [Polyangiales bacterium]
MIAPVSSKRSFHLVALAAVLLLPSLVGCAGTKFDVQSAPGWARANHRISTFGVKRDGLMMRDGWHALGPEMPAPFGANSCEVAYTTQNVTNMPELASAVDDYIRAHGVTDALLAQFTPVAQGDAILFIAISGSPQHTGDSGPPSAAAMGGRGRVGMQGGAFGGGGAGNVGTSSSDSGGGFEVDAVFYSVADKRSVAEIRMNYRGKRIDDALQLFNQRFAKEFPGTQCRGWNWSAHVDPAAIKKLGAP